MCGISDWSIHPKEEKHLRLRFVLRQPKSIRKVIKKYNNYGK